MTAMYIMAKNASTQPTKDASRSGAIVKLVNPSMAKFNNFPKDFSIDYESLDKLDAIRNLLVNRNDVIDLILNYRNFAVSANAMNCISIKNIRIIHFYLKKKL